MIIIRTITITVILLPQFDLNLMPTLLQLLNTHSVTRAAEKLGKTQPSVSRSLAQLRELFNDPLLIRTASGMELTQRAEELLLPLQQWVNQAASFLEPSTFRPDTLNRTFRIASTDFGISEVLAPALPTIHAHARLVSFDISPLMSDMMARLSRGEVDLIISGLDSNPNIAHERWLFTEGFDCLMAPGHVLAGDDKKPLTLDEFLAFPHISMIVSDMEFDRVDQRLGKDAHLRHVIARLPYFQTAPQMIGSTDAIMTMPRRSARLLARTYGLPFRPAPEIIGSFEYRLIWHERCNRDPATIWLIDMIARACVPAPPDMEI